MQVESDSPYGQPDDELRHRFVSRYGAEHPSLFEIVLEAGAEARLPSLRVDPIGQMAFRLVAGLPCDRERFERLLAERVSVSIYLQVDVESSQSV